ncbi:MAG TPA: Fic family protein [Verrucomicrobiae bacterium]|nr:Fic family protein [Verrucomicrobiae bacterium]
MIHAMRLPEPPPTLDELLKTNLLNQPQRLEEKLALLARTGSVVRGRYLHWDSLRHLEKHLGLTTRDWWLGIKMARAQLLRPIPLRDKKGAPFRFATPDHILETLHRMDQIAGGRIEIAEEVTNAATRDRYIINSLVEEAITSSQLEGASTTVEVAKKMLREGRAPSDKSERMIYNNYQAMQHVREMSRGTLTPALVFELHRMLTDGTLDDPGKAGTFRTEVDEIIVEWRGVEVHVPPPVAQLEERLALMCRFANERPPGVFIHPVIRAVSLHFWLAYDHPFVDGNGRAARALFYWSMLSQGYWLTEYLSISNILKKAPAPYARSFLLTESDENDLTYFLEYQLGVVHRSIDHLMAYLKNKIEEVRQVEAELRLVDDLNHRQMALVGHALRHPGHRYSFAGHRRSHNVVYQTARADLLDLEKRGLLERGRRGKAYSFSAPADIARRLKGAGGPARR